MPRAEGEPQPRRYRLGAWLVDESDGTLSRDGEVRRLEPRVMGLLAALVRRHGHVVSRQRLLDDVWAGVHVHEIALTRSVSELRKALGDDPRQPRYVETLPKRGYRLVAPVESARGESGAASGDVSERGSDAPQHRIGPVRVGVGVLVAVLVAVAALVGAAAYRAAAESEPTAVSQDATAAELYERGIRFYERRRYQDNENALELFRAALRRDPGLDRARAALADAVTMKARHHDYDPEVMSRAIELAREAALRGPEVPEAFKALGFAYSTRGWLRRAEVAYRRAVALRPSYAAALHNLAVILWQRGERADALERAIEAVRLSPEDPAMVASLASMLGGLDFDVEAERWLRRAESLEPRRVGTVLAIAYRAALDGRAVEAVERLSEVQASVPDCAECLRARAEIELYGGDVDAAAPWIERYYAEAPGWPPARLYMALLLRRHDPGRFAEILATTETAARAYRASGTESWWAPWNLAVIASLRGQRREALEWLERTVVAGRLDWRRQRRDPLFAWLAADAEFEALIAEMRRRVEVERRRAVDRGLPARVPSPPSVRHVDVAEARAGS